MLSLNGIKAVEVEKDKLGIPVTASFHVRVPPQHNAVFKVNIHAEMQGTQVITGNKHLLENIQTYTSTKFQPLPKRTLRYFL